MQTTALGVIGVFFLLKSINNKKNVREGTGSVLLKDKCETRYSTVNCPGMKHPYFSP
jgi:hypothetical protein